MADFAPKLKPRKLSAAELMRSNVFVAWSRKAGRQVTLIGPNQFDAWHLVEFDAQVTWFCERPPIDLDLLPLDGGKRRPLDFWVRRKSSEQTGIIVHDSKVRDKAFPLDLIRKSQEASKLKCEVWQACDLRSRAVYLRNLRQLQAFVAVDEPSDEQLAAELVAHLSRTKKATWSELLSLTSSRFEGHVNAEIARCIHTGQILANLSDHLLASTTVLSIHEPG